MNESLWEILVPTMDNEGKPFRTRHHKEWDRRVMRLTTGLTVLKPAYGKWMSETCLVDERNIPVRIMCDYNTMNQIVWMTLQHYRQKAVMYWKITDEVFIQYA